MLTLPKPPGRVFSRVPAIVLVLCTYVSCPPSPASAAGQTPLVLLADQDYPPLSYLEAGVAKGMDVEVAEALTAKMGRPIQIELMDWGVAQARVLRGEADGLLSLSASEERQKLYDFTEPTLTHEFGVFVRSENLAIHGVSDLPGKRVGVTAGGFPRAFLATQPLINAILIKNYEDGFDRLTAGSIDAVVADLWVAAYVIQQRGVRGVAIAGSPFAKLPGGIAVRKGNLQLVYEINRAVRQLREDGTLTRIQEKWRPQEMVFFSRQRVQRTITLVAGIFIAMLLAGLVVWIVTLKKQARIRRQAEKALSESDLRLRTALAAAEMGTWRWTAATDESIWDAGFSRMLGQEPQDSHRRLEDFFNCVHPDDRAATKAEFDRAIRDRNTFSSEFRIVQPSGTVRWLRGQGRPFYHESGDLSYVTGAAVDITNLKQAEEELRKERDFTNALVQACPAYFVAIGRRLQVMEMNDAMLNALGYKREEVIGTDYPSKFLPESERSAVARIFQGLLGGAGITHSTNRILTSTGGELLVEWSGRCIFQSNGEPDYFLGIGTDITERKRAEEERHRLEGQLLQAQKMESIGRLAGGVAHDFNNLLTVINGYSDLILTRLQENDPLRGQLRQIRKAGGQASSLTQQLLAFSRRQVSQPQPFSLDEVILSSQKMFARLVGEDIEVVAVPGAGGSRVMADPNHINQVLMNLVANGRDAMPNGGRLVITTSNVDLLPGDPMWDAESVSGAYVMLAVSDTGNGIAEDTQQHIFEPFFTTKGTGTGLGLSTVYGIVKQSGGFIRIQSALGVGTEFRIYLPRTEAPALPEPGVRPGSACRRGSETVLVVEDQENVRSLVVEALRDFGYQVLAAASGKEAIQKAESYSGVIHLLLTDLVMPGQNGKDVAERLRVQRPSMQVLYMSGYTDEVLGHHGVLDAALEYISKPFSPQALASRIQDILGSAPRQERTRD